MENQAIKQIADKYRNEGFEVIERPSGEDIPSFAKDFGPVGLIANKGNEHVIVEVKEHRSNLAEDPRLSRMAEVTNAQPGWRFDLVVLQSEPGGMRSVRGAAEPTPAHIESMVDEAEKLLQANLRMWSC